MHGTKTETVKIEDSNLANYGGKDMKDLRKAAAETEAEWKGCGKSPGVEVWRIEKFQIKKWPKEKYGSFFSGDTYIILNTYKIPDNPKLLYNAHFWLGSKSSQDEQGTAAYKTVELDDLLGDLPVQYREVQGYESEDFKKLFSKLNIMEGGVDSGFKHVMANEYPVRLLQVKGTKTVTVTEVELKHESLNNGDVFVLDAGLNVWQWNGAESNYVERGNANMIVEGIKQERGGRPTSAILDGLEKDERFWKFFGFDHGGMPRAITKATPDTGIGETPPKLFQLNDGGGDKFTFKEVARGKIPMDKLKTDDAFVLDVGFELYIWIGKESSRGERAKAMSYATRYLRDGKRPMYTPITRVIEGAHDYPIAFTRAFEGFEDAPDKSSGQSGFAAGHSASANKARRMSQQGSADHHYEGVFKLTAVGASELPDTEFLGKNDPFIKVILDKQKFKTKPHQNGGKGATWGETFNIELHGPETEFHFEVINDNVFHNVMIGECSLPLAGLFEARDKVVELELTRKAGTLKGGKIQLKITYVPPLRLRVNEGKELYDTEWIGKQDPFARVKLGQYKLRTPTATDMGRTPAWKQGNVFSANLDLVVVPASGASSPHRAISPSARGNASIKAGEQKEVDKFIEFEIWDENLIKNALIGVFKVNVKDALKMDKGAAKWFPITRSWTDTKPAGEISVTAL